MTSPLFVHAARDPYEVGSVIPVHDPTRYWVTRTTQPNMNRVESLREILLQAVTDDAKRRLLLPRLASSAGSDREVLRLAQSARTAADVQGLLQAIAEARTASQARLERVFEQERPRAAPSRRACLFACERNGWAEVLGRMGIRDGRPIFEIEPLSGKIHRADARWLDHRSDMGNAVRAAHYWSGAMTEAPLVEMLIEGPVRVVRRIE